MRRHDQFQGTALKIFKSVIIKVTYKIFQNQWVEVPKDVIVCFPDDAMLRI